MDDVRTAPHPSGVDSLHSQSADLTETESLARFVLAKSQSVATAIAVTGGVLFGGIAAAFGALWGIPTLAAILFLVGGGIGMLVFQQAGAVVQATLELVARGVLRESAPTARATGGRR